MIIRETKIIDYKGRVLIPKETFNHLNFQPGDSVYFESTKSGNLLIKKAKSNNEKASCECPANDQ